MSRNCLRRRRLKPAAPRFLRGGGGCHTAAENEAFVRRLIEKQHFSALEFGSITVLFIVDRAIANELTRRRHISCVQESTKMYGLWEGAVLACEHAYLEAVRYGLEPEYARSMLPHCLGSRPAAKAGFRERRHPRAAGGQGGAHCAEKCPAVFGGLFV